VLLDTTTVLLAVGLAVAGFAVVVVVSAVVLRLIGFIVGDYDPDPGEPTGADSDDAASASGESASPESEPGTTGRSESG
jgi:hypothetical protein